MKSLVVYDSWYGNTQKIAEAIASGLDGQVRVIKADNDPYRYIDECELLIVGSPTHGGVASPAIQEFLKGISPDDLEGIAVAAFDTRVTFKWLKVIGFAAKRIAKQLQQKDGSLVGEPAGFYVHSKEGPLLDGETERATQWASQLVKSVRKGAFV